MLSAASDGSRGCSPSQCRRERLKRTRMEGGIHLPPLALICAGSKKVEQHEDALNLRGADVDDSPPSDGSHTTIHATTRTRRKSVWYERVREPYLINRFGSIGSSRLDRPVEPRSLNGDPCNAPFPPLALRTSSDKLGINPERTQSHRNRNERSDTWCSSTGCTAGHHRHRARATGELGPTLVQLAAIGRTNHRPLRSG